MSDNDRIIEYAREMSWITLTQGLESLTPSKYRKAALHIRPAKQKVVDAAVALESRAATSLGLRTVPLHITGANQAICEACPDDLFALLAGDRPVCTKCNCADKFLEAKWKDKRQFCPRGYWDNRQVKEQ